MGSWRDYIVSIKFHRIYWEVTPLAVRTHAPSNEARHFARWQTANISNADLGDTVRDLSGRTERVDTIGIDSEIGALSDLKSSVSVTNLVLGGVPQIISGGFKSESENSNSDSRERGEGNRNSIKGFSDLPGHDKGYMIGDAFFVVGLGGLLAILYICRNPS